MSKLLSQLIKEYESREARGFSKYGTTMDRDDLSLAEWIQHALEESMDLSLYLFKIKMLLNDTQRRTDYQEENSRVNGSSNTDGEADYPRASL